MLSLKLGCAQSPAVPQLQLVFPPGQNTVSVPGIGRTIQFWREGSGFPNELDYLLDLRRCWFSVGRASFIVMGTEVKISKFSTCQTRNQKPLFIFLCSILATPLGWRPHENKDFAQTLSPGLVVCVTHSRSLMCVEWIHKLSLLKDYKACVY